MVLVLLLGACSARSEVAATCENAAITATHELGGEPVISDRQAMVQACLRRHDY